MNTETSSQKPPAASADGQPTILKHPTLAALPPTSQGAAARSSRTLVTAATLIAVAAALFYWHRGSTSHLASGAAPGPVSVDVAHVITRSIVDWQNVSGRLQAVESVEVRPQVSGRIAQVHFLDGALVKRGDVLFTIDPRPYQAEVDRIQAQLVAAKARVDFTASEFARAERLIGDNAIAKTTYDDRQNAAREAAASALAVQAQLDAARLNLEYTRVTAPIDGRVSRAEITVGNVVEPGLGSHALTSLVSTATLYAAADVDEQTYLKYGEPVRAAGTAVPVGLGLANETGYSRTGKLSSVDNRLDVSSGTIRVRAVFDNPDGKLVPGLFARIRFGGTPHNAVLVDDRAIGTDQEKRFVLVVDSQNKVSYREVRLGAPVSGLRVIERGLEGNERTVVSGTQLVRPGDTVKPHEVAMNGTDLPKTASDAASAAAVVAKNSDEGVMR